MAGPLRLSGKEPGGEGLVSRLRISLISREPGEALEVSKPHGDVIDTVLSAEHLWTVVGGRNRWG